MRAVSLQSGSNGNCIYVESGGVRLLFDAGIPGATAEERLLECGRDIRQVDAVIISHEHTDHIKYAGVYQRKYGLNLHVTEKTIRSALKRFPFRLCPDRLHYFRSGEKIDFGNITVETVSTPHDGVDGSGFIVSCKGKRLGILTDLGHVFSALEGLLSTLDAVFLESNYDEELLRTGPYPWFLKKRIEGPAGHLSNRESANLIKKRGRSLKWACLAHLSEQNNSPELAMATHMSMNPGLSIHAASRYTSTCLFRL